MARPRRELDSNTFFSGEELQFLLLVKLISSLWQVVGVGWVVVAFVSVIRPDLQH
jgi:hypothetical protein